MAKLPPALKRKTFRTPANSSKMPSVNSGYLRVTKM